MRPSAKPYVSPCQRSQTTNKELTSVELSTVENVQEDDESEVEEEWEKLLDSNEDLLPYNPIEEVKN